MPDPAGSGSNWELTSAGDDFLAFHRGGGEPAADVIDGLSPDREYEFHGVAGRTLARPAGELLCRFATVNDVHFGEVVCGYVNDTRELIDYVPEKGSPFGTRAEVVARWDEIMADLGPLRPLSAEPGEEPYPDRMNRAAIAEIASIDPAVVMVKGDLTSSGSLGEYGRFRSFYEAAFGDRLMVVRGNHDAMAGERFEAAPWQVRHLPGVTLVLFDTVVEGRPGGRFTAEQAEWLDATLAEADRPVLAFGHHHVWDPGSGARPDDYFGIRPSDSERLVSVVGRHLPSVHGYFAGHTHRNKVRRFAATGDFPWVEVTTVKDHPGCWAEYRVFEGGVEQIVHRMSSPEALDWSERCRAMFWGLYPALVVGSMADRCFTIPLPAAGR